MSKIFNATFDSINTVVEFNPKWKNGTGYFDHAVEDSPVSVMSKTTDDHGRKIILVPTPVGNAVVFQRFKNDDSVVVCNIPQPLKVLAGSVGLESSLSEAAIEWVVGNQEIGEADVGVRLNSFIRRLK